MNRKKGIFEVTVSIDVGVEFADFRLTASENGLEFSQSFSDAEVFDARRALMFYELFRGPFSRSLMRAVRDRYLILLHRKTCQ